MMVVFHIVFMDLGKASKVFHVSWEGLNNSVYMTALLKNDKIMTISYQGCQAPFILTKLLCFSMHLDKVTKIMHDHG